MALPKLNLAALKGGPAMLFLGGTAIFTKDGVDLDPDGKHEDITLDGFDVVDRRKAAMDLPIKFTPSGVYNAAHIAALCPHLGMALGRYITPVVPFTTADATAETLTATAHGIPTGTAGYVTGEAIPAGLTPDTTLYYIRAATADSVTVHPTRADALANTNAVNLTGTTVTNAAIVINNELIIQSYLGVQLKFHNFGIVKQPNLLLTASGKTIFGSVEAGAFLRHNKAPSDANSYFTVSSVAFDPSTFPDVSTILTQPYEAEWDGASAPWNNIRSKEGFNIAPNSKLDDVTVDGLGVVTKQLTGGTVEVSFIPTDAGESDLLSLLKVQGDGADMGTSLQEGSHDLNIIGTNFYSRIYSANMTKGPSKWNIKDRRAGEVTFQATRQFPGGSAQPLMFLGTESPD